MTPHKILRCLQCRGVGTPHIKMCSDVHTRVGKWHLKMCSNVQNKGGDTAHKKSKNTSAAGVGGWVGF